MLESDAAEFGGAFEVGAEALGDADRRAVLGANKAGGTGDRKMREEPVASGAGGLGRIAPMPEGLVERIGDLRLGPVERLEDADAADETVARDRLDGPHAIAAQRPRARP